MAKTIKTTPATKTVKNVDLLRGSYNQWPSVVPGITAQFTFCAPIESSSRLPNPRKNGIENSALVETILNPMAPALADALDNVLVRFGWRLCREGLDSNCGIVPGTIEPANPQTGLAPGTPMVPYGGTTMVTTVADLEARLRPAPVPVVAPPVAAPVAPVPPAPGKKKPVAVVVEAPIVATRKSDKKAPSVPVAPVKPTGKTNKKR